MAAARAAARREAILNSRGDRLAKLTSSARGDDPGGVYAHDDPPLPTVGTGLKKFVGEESTLPTPPANTSRSQATDPFDTGANPQFTAQQQELLRALMGGAAIGQPGLQLPSGPANADANADPNAVPPASPEDPLSTLLASLGGSAGGPFGATGPGSAFGAAGSLFGGSASPPPQTQRPRTLVQKLVPVLHVLSMLAMLVWFVGWKEPEEFAETWLSNSVKEDESFGVGGKEFGWKRWARLARGPPVAGLVVSPIPAFFWAFTTLQLALHSLRLFSEPKVSPPHFLLGLALPYLPPPLPQVIRTSLKYLQMLNMVIDDLAILVFGIGLVIFVSNWVT